MTFLRYDEGNLIICIQPLQQNFSIFLIGKEWYPRHFSNVRPAVSGLLYKTM
ncbi:MAG: hypothetical protein HC895_25425 [Leptolyngbyaceae cyanobacterium SM1_3_5]|nr:hypothetical protein [Leptolyngbyaceae cyanobacterium SM1_3_5]